MFWYSSRVPAYPCFNSSWRLIILTSISPVCSTPIFGDLALKTCYYPIRCHCQPIHKYPIPLFYEILEWLSQLIQLKPWALCSQSQRKMDGSAPRKTTAVTNCRYLVREEETIQGLVAWIKIHLAYGCPKRFRGYWGMERCRKVYWCGRMDSWKLKILSVSLLLFLDNLLMVPSTFLLKIFS